MNIPAPTHHDLDLYRRETLKGILDAAAQGGHRLHFVSESAIPTSLDEDLDGILWVSPSQADQGKLAALASAERPVVLVNRTASHPALSYVTNDHQGGAYRAVRYLIQLGHRRIAYIGGASHIQPFRQRMTGYLKALEDGGVATDPDLMLEFTAAVLATPDALSAFLARTDASALFVAWAGVTLHVTLELERIGRRVPADVSVVTFGDTRHIVAALTEPPGYVDEANEALGQAALSALLELKTSGNHAPIRRVLPLELVLRGSCAPWNDRTVRSQSHTENAVLDMEKEEGR